MERLITLTNNAPTAAMVKDAVQDFQEQVILGNVAPTNAEVFIKTLEDFCKEYRKNADIKQMVLDTAKEEGGKIVLNNGTTIQSVVTRKWDYTVSPRWRELSKQKEQLDLELKDIEAKVKACAENKMAYTEEGESITDFECIESVALRTTLPKK